MHFALVCGANSCPSISCYSADNIYHSLESSARAFFENGTVVIDQEKRVVKLNAILKWYRSDFGENDDEVLTFIIKYSSEQQASQLEQIMKSKYTIKYLKYDWSTNKV